ncbi:MAG TPA: universal stress protein [Methylocella sp.]|nr:universal stress protein [Methylocella sp.]
MSYTTLMVCCDLNPIHDNRLHITASLAERFEAKVIGIAAQAEIIPLTLAEGDAFTNVDMWEQNQAKIAQRLQLVEERFREVFKGRAKQIEWRSEVGEPVSFIAKESRAADLVIAGKSTDDTSLDPADLVMQTGRPLLMIPNGIEALKAERILVAWKDTREARRAIYDALPLLRRCQNAIVAEIDEDHKPAAANQRVEDVAAWLVGHGVKATARSEPLQNSAAAQLDGLADAEGLDLIVAGAYGHGRFREWVFGGVTRDLLTQTSRCHLLAH